MEREKVHYGPESYFARREDPANTTSSFLQARDHEDVLSADQSMGDV
jgi:hypothetical protein